MELTEFTNEALMDIRVRPVAQIEEVRYQEQMARADGASPFFSALAKIGETVISGLDFPQRLTLSGILEVPFKKSRNRLVGLFATGWQLQAWYEGQSGEALGFGNTAFRGNLADIAYPANQRFPTRCSTSTQALNVTPLKPSATTFKPSLPASPASAH